jgi:coniferyl-aldehyde dehydrogenase
MRPVFYQTGFSGMKYLSPPYGRFATRVLNFMAKRKG